MASSSKTRRRYDAFAQGALVPLPRLMRAAHIFGPSSAAARALREYTQRRSEGEAVEVRTVYDTYVVGPAVQPGEKG